MSLCTGNVSDARCANQRQQLSRAHPAPCRRRKRRFRSGHWPLSSMRLACTGTFSFFYSRLGRTMVPLTGGDRSEVARAHSFCPTPPRRRAGAPKPPSKPTIPIPPPSSCRVASRWGEGRGGGEGRGVRDDPDERSRSQRCPACHRLLVVRRKNKTPTTNHMPVMPVSFYQARKSRLNEETPHAPLPPEGACAGSQSSAMRSSCYRTVVFVS